jgi:AcrR family transcriptional regulator
MSRAGALRPEHADAGAPESRVPPRERIIAVASDLFYRHGIRAVGVEAIAEAAETNKMTLYRHFVSKDELVAEYLRRLAQDAAGVWTELAEKFPGDARAQIRGWLKLMNDHTADPTTRGCAFANAAVELPEKDHPARRVIEESKRDVRANLARLCKAAGLRKPELLADELFVLLEGTHVCAQSFGAGGRSFDLVRMGETLIEAHSRQA